jgi:hypothetical protein
LTNFSGAQTFNVGGGVNFSVFNQTDSLLTKGFTYYYRVFSVNSAGVSDASNVSFEMAISKPSVVQNASIQIAGPLIITLRWRPPSDTGNGEFAASKRPLMSYLLQIDNTSSNFDNVVWQQNLSSTTQQVNITEPLLSVGVDYNFRIAAINAAGLGQFCYQGDSFTPGLYFPVSANLTQTAITVPSSPINDSTYISNPGEITVRWRIPANTGALAQRWPLLEYTLQVDFASTFSNPATLFQGRILHGVDVNTLATASSRFTYALGNLSEGVTYYFRVFARNEAGESAASPVMKQIALFVPNPPQNLTVSIAGPLTLNVSFSVPHLVPGDAIIRYILEMEVAQGNFSDSPFVPFCFASKVPPCALTGDSPYDLGILGSSGLVYSAGCPAGVSYSLKCTSWRQQVYNGVFSVALTGLGKGQRYFFRVFAQNDAGLSAAAGIASQQAISEPGAPRTFALGLTGSSSFLLTWGVPADTGNLSSSWPLTAYGVQVQARLDLSLVLFTDADIVGFARGDETKFDLTGDLLGNLSASREKKLFVRIFAVNQAGRGPFSPIEDNGPRLDGIVPNSGSPAGGYRITVNGLRFGDLAEGIKVRIGETHCDRIAFVEYQSSLSCVVPPGISGRYSFYISVFDLAIARENTFFYLGPQVSSLEPSSVSRSGGVAVTVRGSNVGVFDPTPVALFVPEREGPQRCLSTVWTSDSSIACVVPDRGVRSRGNNSIAVTIGSETSVAWAAGSRLVLNDLPAYFECERSTTPDCYSCALDKCFVAEVSLAMGNGGVLAARPPSSCEAESLAFCNYSARDDAIPQPTTLRLTGDALKADSIANTCKIGSSFMSKSLKYDSDSQFRYIRSKACRQNLEAQGTSALEPETQEFLFILPRNPIFQQQAPPLASLRFQGVIGVAVNGVPIYSNFRKDGQNALLDEGKLDHCGGHISESGIYHFHSNPVCIYENSPGVHSPLVGFMIDGVPIYGNQDQRGLPPTNLDECNGHIDPEIKHYHYHFTPDFPFSIKCFKGCLSQKTVEAVNWSLMGKTACKNAKKQQRRTLGPCDVGADGDLRCVENS